VRSRHVPRHLVAARILRVTVAQMIMLAFRTRAQGIENVPATGGVILAGNHVSYADPVLIWCRAPRLVRFMGKSELWDSALLGFACDQVLAFPIRRGAADREAILAASGFLRSGEIVGMFPEGARQHDGLGEAHSGVAFLAVREGVPIVPVGIAGTDLIRPPGSRMIRFPRVAISFGAPLHPDGYTQGGRRERVDAMTADLMTRIAEELERAKEAR
jgi:1-acyl-sn-glycerol-3-phosphate acyltransferase